MGVRVTAIIVVLVAAGAPALAAETHARKPARTHVAALQNPAAPVAAESGAVRPHRVVKATRKRAKGGEARAATEDDDASAAPSPNFSEAIGWRLIEDRATGARLGLPEKLVPRAGASRTGSRWSSAQGQIVVETFRFGEAALPALFEGEKKASHRQIVSSDLKSDSFVIAGVQGLKNFLVRAAARGSEVRGVTVLYDQATEGTMERVAHAMAAAFVGFPDPNAAPPPGVRRAVEYGSAIVVTSFGALIAPAHVVDDCRAIVVPPLGHAEHIAEDRANDVALIRLYGARNLVAAPISGQAGQSQTGDLTLVGVADPLVQAGGAGAADVSSAAARATAQGIEPAPKPGFSGAAAIDADGVLAGMVDVKPAVVAGGGSVAPAATLVSAGAIRVFLQTQGVAPDGADTGHAAIDQSVMRVICVRK